MGKKKNPLGKKGSRKIGRNFRWGGQTHSYTKYSARHPQKKKQNGEQSG